jgi:glycosyltransferase involved in cell wall biosynthesis
MSERRYRVLAVATHPVQYMAPIFRRMANHSAFDLHVTYCTPRGAKAEYDPEFDADIQWDVPLFDGYSWSQVLNRGSGAGSFFGLFNPAVWKLIGSGTFDAVLCFTGYRCATFWITLIAARISKTAILFGADATTLASRDGRAWKTRLKKILWPCLFGLADQVIVPSSGSHDLMLSLGLPSERVTVTPYSIDNDWWIQRASRVDRAATRAVWGASPNDSVILFCAKLQPWKRPVDLLRAFAKANIPNTLLLFAGEGPLRPQLESEATTLGVASRVRFLGFVNQSQLPSIYSSADLMVLPSEYEPFAVVVNEAMCCSCPVVVSNRVGAALDLVFPVSPQFVFPCGGIDELASILKDALADREKLQTIARAALRHIRTWSPERNVAATLDAIRAGVTRVGRPPATKLADSVVPHDTAAPTSKPHV